MTTRTLEIIGNLYKKSDTTAEVTVAINPSKIFTEYTQQRIIVGAGDSETINLGGIAYPKFMYIETDNAVELKAFRGADVVASSFPVDDFALLSGNSAKRYGTVSVTNSGVDDANVDIYICG